MTDQSPTRDELIERLEGELAEMASACSVQMELWDRFSNRVLRAISLLRSDSQRIAELEGRLKASQGAENSLAYGSVEVSTPRDLDGGEH